MIAINYQIWDLKLDECQVVVNQINTIVKSFLSLFVNVLKQLKTKIYNQM